MSPKRTLVAVAVSLVSALLAGFTANPRGGDPALFLCELGLGLLSGFVLCWPRLAACAAVVVLASMHLLEVQHVGLGILAPAVIAPACILLGRPRTGWGSLAAIYALVYALAYRSADGLRENLVAIGFFGLVFIVPAIIAQLYYSSRSNSARLLAERDRNLQEFRGRLARELHDTAVNSMTMVAMLARKASERDAPASRPEELKELARISERAVLEMRYLLQLIRVPGAVPSGPEHRDLTSLVDYEVTRAKSHGFSVKLVTSGLPAHLGSGSRLLLEKVLSEGISNVIRHGDPAREVLLMVHIDSSIELTIINRPAGDRRRPWPSSLSFGLTSVRELVEAAGGVVEADSQGGQWVLNVVLPQASQSPIVVTQEPSGTAGSDG